MRDFIDHDLDGALYYDQALQVDSQDFPIEVFCESLMDYISISHFEMYQPSSTRVPWRLKLIEHY
jgi:hypothetical protein